MSLPKPGEVWTRDFRGHNGHHQVDRPLRLVQWNIERGYELEKVIEELRRIDGDIIALQEVDVGCKRSNEVDTGVAIAEALQLNYAFICEFEELLSPLRDPMSQGGGVHGNAILTKFDMTDCRPVEHRHHPVDWERPDHPLAKKEPRRGRRLTLAATVQCPAGPLLLYCCHLEVFCGMLSRIAQFTDILRDSRIQIQKGLYHQAILGDLNTMAHGIARLSPHYCCDHMRFWTIGRPEAHFWQENLFSITDERYIPDNDGQNKGERSAGPGSSSCSNAKLAYWGVPAEVCRDALNPGFTDPFPTETITLDNAQYRFFGVSLMKGKLDWLLLRRLEVISTSIGNHDYKASDHKWLSADVHFNKS